MFTVHAFADYDGDDTSDCIYYIHNIIILEKPNVEDDDGEDDDAFIFALLEYALRAFQNTIKCADDDDVYFFFFFFFRIPSLSNSSINTQSEQ